MLDHNGSNAPLFIQRMRVRSLGLDNVRVQQVILKVLPPNPAQINSIVFAYGLDFGDWKTGKGRDFPGRPSRGDYGYALELNRQSTPNHPSIPATWKTGHGTLIIPLEKGQKLISIDIACGDMKRVPRGADPQDYRGGGSLTVLVKNASNSVLDSFMNRENVGTNGVMRGFTKNPNFASSQGDYIEVSAPSGTVKIMGIRLGVNK